MFVMSMLCVISSFYQHLNHTRNGLIIIEIIRSNTRALCTTQSQIISPFYSFAGCCIVIYVRLYYQWRFDYMTYAILYWVPFGFEWTVSSDYLSVCLYVCMHMCLMSHLITLNLFIICCSTHSSIKNTNPTGQANWIKYIRTFDGFSFWLSDWFAST